MVMAAMLVASAHVSAAPDQYLAVQSLNSLYISSDSGSSWQNLDILKDINRATYLTAASRHQTKPNLILVGTSFEGIYESKDNGKTWTFLSDGRTFKVLSQGAGFYEEVDAIAYAKDGSEDFVFRAGYNGKSYRFNRTIKTVSEIDPKSTDYTWLPAAFSWSYNPDPQNPSWNYTLPPADPNVPLPPGMQRPEPSLVGTPADDPQRAERRKLASDKRGFYISPSQASSRNLPAHLDFAVKNNLNSIVVDFKDDQGLLTYDSKVPVAVENKATLKRIDMPKLIEAAHAKGIYVIARVVVFKDKQLYRYNKNQFAVWDRANNRPWGVFREEEVAPAKAGDPVTREWVQTEYWVDEYSDFVHQYNIQIAKEAQALGADEIQFDYIRFASDGNTNTMMFRHHVDADGKYIKDETMQDRVSALAGFLRKAREAISIPIGTDVFGFNGWARMSYLGQDIQAISYFVDVISPMMYPSHYARDFLGAMNYFDRASYIYEVGTKRARILAGDRALIRPYVQAFLLGGELKFSDPQIFDYLNRQVKSSYQGGASGFTLWNNSGRYYMVDQKNFKQLF